jgi:GMP synthase (glutamine-hydrolysing)
MRRTQTALRHLAAHDVPVLGICFGHQLLAVALGGRSGPNPCGREIGTVGFALESRDDVLFRGAPPSFPVSMTHLDTVLELPPGAAALGSTDLDRYAAIRFADRVWGVQFHPEMGADIIGAYVAARRDALRGEGLDPDALLGGGRDTPAAAALLPRFAALAAGCARGR